MFAKIAVAILLSFTGLLFLFFIYAVVQSVRHPQKSWLEKISANRINLDTLKTVKNYAPWEYSSKEDRMTSAITYTAEHVSEENVRTGGHWEDRSSVTTTTQTEITEKKPLFRNKTSLDRLINPNKVNASTSTTTTSSTHPEWVGKEGPMVLCLRSKAGKRTSVIFYSSTRELPIDFSSIRVRFDKNEPKRFGITPTSFNKSATDGFIVNSSGEFLDSLKGANTILVQMSDDDDDFIFSFHVAELKWEH